VIKFKKKTCRVVLDQIRIVDKRRIIKSLGYLKPAEIADIKRVISEMVVQ
jgi:mRNA-degrading endonuclease toxin of MazEF toxin-antitoxin module